MLKNINSTSPIPKYSPRCRRESFTPAKLCQTTHVYRVDLHAQFHIPFRWDNFSNTQIMVQIGISLFNDTLFETSTKLRD